MKAHRAEALRGKAADLPEVARVAVVLLPAVRPSFRRRWTGWSWRPGGNESSGHRYNLTPSVMARNALNHQNLSSPVGVVTSPYFLQSTSIAGGFGPETVSSNQRRIDFQFLFGPAACSMAAVPVSKRYADGVPDSTSEGALDKLTDYTDDGVDLTLIRWMLSLTPAERLEFLDERIEEIEAIRKLNAR